MNNKDINNKNDFEILRLIAKNPDISQRKLSKELGFSLGKLNYCIKSLQKKGLIKIQNFKENKNKLKYLYILTPLGISKKTKLTVSFIKNKISEYDKLIKEEASVLENNNKLKEQVKEFGIGHNSSILNPQIEENKTRTKPLFKTIQVNLKRRTVIVDDVLSLHEGSPIPSWIELSIIDVCNRSCSFCPKSDPKVAPNTYQRMQMNLIDKLARELKEIKYKGSVVLCGYGEPMLHKEVNLICKKLSEVSYVEVVTNGDTLRPNQIRELYANNVNKLLISMYDGEHQIKKFNEMIEDSKVPKDFVILRDRWYDSKKDYGLKLTNRTGTINIGDQEEIGKYKKCFYPSYQFLIDWNGDIFLCPQDWQRRVTMGNMMQEHIFDIWTSKIMTKYRKDLIFGKRDNSPCTMCNAEGTVLGKNHANEWAKIYSRNL
ncbi:MarR family EPS-associated transcriptional regulator [Candidatus Pelagibacter sp.]|nr:MarR family EPS-associated transcriptional regulator [Candidatus Pelagibacter sp.]